MTELFRAGAWDEKRLTFVERFRTPLKPSTSLGWSESISPYFLFGPWLFIDEEVYRPYMSIPQYHEMMIPTIKAIDELGGSGTIQEIAEGVIQLLGLPEEITSQPHNPEKSSQTEVEYRLAWARTYLKKVGLIENSERGVWSFTENYRRGMKLDAEEIVQTVRGLRGKGAKRKVFDEAPETIPQHIWAGAKASALSFCSDLGNH